MSCVLFVFLFYYLVFKLEGSPILDLVTLSSTRCLAGVGQVGVVVIQFIFLIDFVIRAESLRDVQLAVHLLVVLSSSMLCPDSTRLCLLAIEMSLVLVVAECRLGRHLRWLR